MSETLAPTAEDFEFDSLEEVVSAYGKKEDGWEQNLISKNNGSSLKNEAAGHAREWVVEEDGKKTSLTESVQGNYGSDRHEKILNELYEKGWSEVDYVDEFTNKLVQEIYFADSKGHISFVSNQFNDKAEMQRFYEDGPDDAWDDDVTVDLKKDLKGDFLSESSDETAQPEKTSILEKFWNTIIKSSNPEQENIQVETIFEIFPTAVAIESASKSETSVMGTQDFLDSWFSVSEYKVDDKVVDRNSLEGDSGITLIRDEVINLSTPLPEASSASEEVTPAEVEQKKDNNSQPEPDILSADDKEELEGDDENKGEPLDDLEIDSVLDQSPEMIKINLPIELEEALIVDDIEDTLALNTEASNKVISEPPSESTIQNLEPAITIKEASPILMPKDHLETSHIQFGNESTAIQLKEDVVFSPTIKASQENGSRPQALAAERPAINESPLSVVVEAQNLVVEPVLDKVRSIEPSLKLQDDKKSEPVLQITRREQIHLPKTQKTLNKAKLETAQAIKVLKKIEEPTPQQSIQQVKAFKETSKPIFTSKTEFAKLPAKPKAKEQSKIVNIPKRETVKAEKTPRIIPLKQSDTKVLAAISKLREFPQKTIPSINREQGESQRPPTQQIIVERRPLSNTLRPSTQSPNQTRRQIRRLRSIRTKRPSQNQQSLQDLSGSTVQATKTLSLAA